MRYLVVLLCSGFVFAQSPTATPQKTLLVGKVLNSVTGEPVRKASVSLLSADGAAGGSALTDATGKFEIADLAPGTYWLMVAREGFVPPNQDGKLKREWVTIAAAEEKRDVIVRLVPLSFITGRIVDEDGDPVRRVTVEAMVYRYTASGRQLASRGEGSTNDLGEYRIFDLNPGRYYLKAGFTKPVYGDETLGPAYFPGTPDAAAASPIELGAGQPAEGIDLTLHPSKVAHIRGQIMNPGNNLTVGLYHITGNGSGTSSSSVADPKGKFELPDVAPGSYTLFAEATIGGQHCGAHLAIQVGSADLEGIELHLLPPVDIAGQFRIEGKTNARMSRLSLSLEDEGHMVQNIAGGEPKDDGSFAVQGLVPGIYQVSVNVPEDLYVKVRALVRPGRDAVRRGSDPGGGRQRADGGVERQRRTRRWRGSGRSISARGARHGDSGAHRCASQEGIAQGGADQPHRQFPDSGDRARQLQAIRLSMMPTEPGDVRSGFSEAVRFTGGERRDIGEQREKRATYFAQTGGGPIAVTFTKRLRERIRRGEITCSVRIWMRPHVKVGHRYRMEEGEIEVESIEPIGLPDITPELARESGFLGVVDLLKVAKHGKGERIYLIRFRYVRPRR